MRLYHLVLFSAVLLAGGCSNFGHVSDNRVTRHAAWHEGWNFLSADAGDRGGVSDKAREIEGRLGVR